MKLYKTVYIDDASDRPSEPKWDGTQGDAVKRRKALKIEGMREVKTEPTNVPTDKAGLLAFLNGGS